jgi:alpha-L-fucosidase
MVFPADRTDWFKRARYGMFIHWGLYSLLGRGEWAMNRERIPLEEYKQLAGQFTASAYRPSEWAALARDAGMRYMVLTTKHHEGFCLWDSKVCSFNATNSAARRDLLAEYVDAARAAGLKVGLYYSLGDWLNPDWADGWRGDVAAKTRFMEYTHALVRELMTDYGTIDLLFYDLPQCYSPEEWRSIELNAMVRSLQPGIVINNRAMTTEDYATPEQHVTASRPGRLWESCMTLNDSWGYRPADQGWKSPTTVARHLAQVAAGGGNLLLNVGPDGQGGLPPQSVDTLRQVGMWLERNHESIFDVERSNLPWMLCGSATVRGNNLYLFLYPYEGSATTLGGLTTTVRRVTWLESGKEVAFEQKGAQTIFRGLPDAMAADVILPVLKVELESPADLDLSRVLGGADIFADFPS